MHWKTQNWTFKSIDLFSDPPFYEELSVLRTDIAFRIYAVTYEVELIDKKDPLSKLEASKPSIKDLLNDILDEKKSFTDQITARIWLKHTKALKLNFLQLFFQFNNKNSGKL